MQYSRDQLIERATQAYSQGLIQQSEFEQVVSRLVDASDPDSFAAIAAALPGGGLQPAGAQGGLPLVWQELSLSMGNLRKQGDWVQADAYRIKLNMSNIRLDLGHYEGVSGFRLLLEVDLSMSNLRLYVPDGWVVQCELRENTASNVRDRGPSSVWGDNRILVTGRLHMSNIKVKYR